MVLQQSVEVFLYLANECVLMHKTTTKKLVPSSKRAELQRERTTPKSRRKRRKKMQKEEPLRRFVFQISRFLRHFFLLFSLFVCRVCWSFSLSSRTQNRISHLPSDRLPRARCALLGFQTREREKERRNKSSVAIINTNNNNNKV